MWDTPELLKYISEEIHSLDIAGYLKEEIYALCKYLHVYKLKNIWDNIAVLKEYLYFLDNHSTEQLALLDYSEDGNPENTETYNVSYYLSQKGVDTIGSDKFLSKLQSHDGELSYVMQGVKWFLLLTADEFCNATPTRLSITRRAWQKQEQEK